MQYRDPVEDTQQTLSEHLDEALENAEDEAAVFHLRQAKQVTAGLPALIDEKSDDDHRAD